MFPAGLGSQKPRFANQQRLAGQKPGSNNIVGGCSMWNPPTALPFVCEIHKLNCPGPLFKNTLILRGACITTICLNLSLQPTELKEKSYKRSPWETHFFWSSESNQTQDPNADDYDKYSPLAEEWGDCNDQDKIDAAEAEAAVAEKKS